MIYQELYQAGGDPSQMNISSVRYTSTSLQPQNWVPATHSSEIYPQHCHSFYEILYVIKGSFVLELNSISVSIPEHSLVFYPPLTVHSFLDEGNSANLILHFSPRLIQTLLSSSGGKHLLTPTDRMNRGAYIQITDDHPLAPHMQRLLQDSPVIDLSTISKAADITSYEPEMELRLCTDLLNLLSQMLTEGLLKFTVSELGTDNFTQMQFLINHLVSSPEQKISMEEAASMVNMSYYNFCRTFTATFGMTYVDFCNKIRIRRSQELLKGTSLSVTEISEILNFGSISYFNRIFKKYTGCTPLNYRSAK